MVKSKGGSACLHANRLLSAGRHPSKTVYVDGMTNRQQTRRTSPRSDDGTILGMFVTVALSLPYLSDHLHWFRRSTGHDAVLAAILVLCWGTGFFWNEIGRMYPKLRHAIVITGRLTSIASIAALYGTAYFLIFTK